MNAALAQRQPGSAIKPLTYAPRSIPRPRPRRAARLDRGDDHPRHPHLVPDRGGQALRPQQLRPPLPRPGHRAHGPGQLVQHPGGANAADRVGVDAWSSWRAQPRHRLAAGRLAPAPGSHRRKPRYGLSLTLGGGEVRLLDLAAAYAAFATGGYRVTPYAIERVETLDGAGLWTHDGGSVEHSVTSANRRWTPRRTAPRHPQPRERVLDPRVAYLITDILSDDLARRPAFGEGNMLEIGRPAAAKTGTTTDWRDNWTIGYTPDLVAGVWVGNADNTPMKDVSGITGAGPIWHDFMTACWRTSRPPQFTVPDGVVQQEVCADSGLLPAEASSQDERQPVQVVPCPSRRLEWFIEGTEPNEHGPATPARDDRRAVGSNSPLPVRRTLTRRWCGS